MNSTVFNAICSEIQRCTYIAGIVTKLNNESAHKLRLAYFEAEIAETEKELSRLSSFRQAVFEDYVSKLLTVSEYRFATEKYNADTAKLRERLETAKNEKFDYIQSATIANKWIATFSRFSGQEELTADMAQALLERVGIFDGDKVSIVFKYQDEYAAVSACIGVNNENMTKGRW